MSRYVEVINRTQASRRLLRARWCDSFACRLRGLTFRRSLKPDEGLLLVERVESRAQTAIHMLMVFFPLGVLWIDHQGMVVDRRVALPWRFYVPSSPAQFVLEGRPEVIQSAALGDLLEFVDAPSD